MKDKKVVDLDNCKHGVISVSCTECKKSGHTPGPWKYHLGRGASPRFHVQSDVGYQIVSTTELDRHPQAFDENLMREANACLIAAAPELKEACYWALMAAQTNEKIGPDIMKLLETALAKAEGK